MNLTLKVMKGRNVGQTVVVSGPKFFIGRAEDCQLKPRSDLISRHHCVLLVEETFVAVRDLGSRNGTFVNGERVTAERELKSGDTLVVGCLEFEIRLATRAVAQQQTKGENVKRTAPRAVEVSQTISEGRRPPGDDAFEIAADTQAIAMHDTTGDVLANTPRTVTETSLPADVPVASAKPEQQPTPPRSPGKLPPSRPKSDSGSSGDAAAELLNKFFKRR
jgi:pSer/pThr/pTyr-binding forkhead associated (FHA) protein